MQNTLIAVFETHRTAVDAITNLKDKGFSSKQLSIIGKADKAKDAVTVDDKDVSTVAGSEVGVGAVLGSTLGVLTGVGIFAIPGLGFLYGAGALIGGIAGFDLGLIGGGVVSALTVAGIKVSETQKYDNYIKEGKFLVVVQADVAKNKEAEKILEEKTSAIEIDNH